MWEQYEGKVVFVTGASGFLGTALVYRLVTTAPVRHIYLLSRGGLPDLRKKWSQWLPSDTVNAMCNENRVTVLKGDLTEANLGLSLEARDNLTAQVNIVIHSASSINLRSGLADLSATVVDASERLALLALHWHHLSHFVYVSTAFCNTHLSAVKVEEAIHPPSQCGCDTIDAERKAIRKPAGQSGTCDNSPRDNNRAVGESKTRKGQGTMRTPWQHGACNKMAPNCALNDSNHIDEKPDAMQELEIPGFLWPYAYAKNLTERLLSRIFRVSNTSSPSNTWNVRFLIVRPSITGPSQCFPYYQFCMPLSCPPVTATAGFCLTPSRAVRFASELANPTREATFEEVPVDVVADRLLLHVAKGTTGVVHAIGGAPVPFQQWWEQMLRLRSIPWKLKPTWIQPGLSADRLHPIAQLMKVIGMAFDFSQEKTVALCYEMDKSELSDLQLFRWDADDRYDLRVGRLQLWYCMNRFTRKVRWKRRLAQVFYGSWAHAARNEVGALQPRSPTIKPRAAFGNRL